MELPELDESEQQGPISSEDRNVQGSTLQFHTNSGKLAFSPILASFEQSIYTLLVELLYLPSVQVWQYKSSILERLVLAV